MRAQVGKYRLKIVEYYDSLLNQIDLCVETYLRDGRDEPGVSLTANTIRDQMFMEIKQVEYENLTNLQSCSIDHVTRLAGHELDRLLFNKHCFLIQRSDFKYPKINVPLFGYLVKTDFYLSDEQLGYFKDTLRNYSCFMGLLSPQNFYFNLNNSIEEKAQMQIKWSLFGSTKNIINLPMTELFRIDKLVIRNLKLDSIKQDAKFLFMNINELEIIFDGMDHESNSNLRVDKIIECFKSLGSTNLKISLDLRFKMINHFDFRPFRTLDIRSVFVQSNNNYSYRGSSDLFLEYDEIEMNGRLELKQALIGLDELQSLRELTLYNKLEYVEPGLLRNLRSLQHLNLSDNKLHVLDSSVVNNLDRLESLILFNNRIEQVNLTHRLELKSLNIGMNRLERLDQSTLRDIHGLQDLSITDNNISYLGPLVFTHLHNLVKLDLSGNRLSILINDAFRGLIKLEDLNLADNQIEWTKSSPFTGLPNLKRLNLKNNMISCMRSEFFTDCGSVEELDLSRNRISSIDTNSMSHLSRLIKLDMSYNLLEVIDEQTFHGMTNLKELHLTRCNINSMKSHSFSSLTRLESLVLKNNDIKQLDDQVFYGLGSLKCLDLTSNHLDFIGKDVFTDLGNLVSLDLSDNKLEKLDKNIFVGLGALRKLHLYKNVIKFIDHDAFSGLGLLQLLNLTDNCLQRIEYSMFNNLSSLSDLHISLNSIDSIDKDSITCLKSLKLLILDKSCSFVSDSQEFVTLRV